MQNFGIFALENLDLAPLEFTDKDVNLANRNAQRDIMKAGTQPFRTGSALKKSGFI